MKIQITHLCYVKELDLLSIRELVQPRFWYDKVVIKQKKTTKREGYNIAKYRIELIPIEI